MKLVLLYSLFLFITAKVLSCRTEHEPIAAPIEPIRYEDYNVYVKLTDSGIIRTQRDSADYIMELEPLRCGGVDTILTDHWKMITRYHNPDSCGHTKII